MRFPVFSLATASLGFDQVASLPHFFRSTLLLTVLFVTTVLVFVSFPLFTVFTWRQ